MADPYTSKYSGAQIDAAVKAIGTIPAVYVSYEEYRSSIQTIQDSTQALVASFQKFFDGVDYSNKTFLQLFNEEITKINNRMSQIEQQYNQLVKDFPGVRFEKID